LIWRTKYSLAIPFFMRHPISCLRELGETHRALGRAFPDAQEFRLILS
jgi:hypothetical protein